MVVTLPLSPETRNLIGEPELLAMRRTAYLVNIARGGIVDEDALIRALSKERMAGAGLDVFAKEPLAPHSLLWRLPNVIISPHVAGIREDYAVLAMDLFCENLRRYLDGQEMLNVVDKKGATSAAASSLYRRLKPTRGQEGREKQSPAAPTVVLFELRKIDGAEVLRASLVDEKSVAQAHANAAHLRQDASRKRSAIPPPGRSDCSRPPSRSRSRRALWRGPPAMGE